MKKASLSLILVALGTPALAHPGHAGHPYDAGVFPLVLAGGVTLTALLCASARRAMVHKARQGARPKV